MSLKGKLLQFGIDISTKLDIAFPYGFVSFFGRLVTVDTTEVNVLMMDGSEDVLMASGETIPTDAESGYAKGCIFIDTDATAGLKALYENVGTNLVCDFDAIGNITTAGEITLADTKLIIGGAAGLGAEYTLSGDVSLSNAGVVTLTPDNIINADINTSAAIDATKIADGSVSNTEFQHLDGLDGNIQDQIDVIETLADGKIYLGDAVNSAEEVTLTGDVTVSNAGVTLIGTGVVEDSMIEGLAAGEIILGVDGTAANNLIAVLSGDVTMDATGAVTVAEGAIEATMVEALADAEFVIGVDGTAANNTKSVMSGDATMTNAGVITVAGFAGDLLVATDKKLQFRDTGIYLQSSADGQLDLVADGEVQIATAAVDINASGNITIYAANIDLTGSGDIVVTATDIDLDVGSTGIVRASGVLAEQQSAPAAKTTAVTLSASELMGRLITATHTVGATQAYTVPTGANLDAALGEVFVADSSFDFTIVNLSAALLDTVTLTANTGVTLVGNALIESAHADSEWMNSGTFRVRKTAADTFVVYRLA